MGFGYLFYEKGEYLQAARCFYTTITFREELVDENSVMLAAPLVNLACCLIHLDKKEKALDYLNISQCVYEVAYEDHDEYILTVKRNIDCIYSQPLYIQPNYQKTWLTYHKSEYKGIGKGGIPQKRKPTKKQ